MKKLYYCDQCRATAPDDHAPFCSKHPDNWPQTTLQKRIGVKVPPSGSKRSSKGGSVTIERPDIEGILATASAGLLPGTETSTTLAAKWALEAEANLTATAWELHDAEQKLERITKRLEEIDAETCFLSDGASHVRNQLALELLQELNR